MAFLIVNVLFLAINIYWYNRLFAKKNQLNDQERAFNKKSVEDLTDDFLSFGGERIKNICERVSQKFPELSKTEIFFNYSIEQLISLLEIGEENFGVARK
jgi:hypothetical protein